PWQRLNQARRRVFEPAGCFGTADSLSSFAGSEQTSFLFQFADEYIRKLHRIAMMLQCDRPALRHSGKLGVLDHHLAVELHGEPVASHNDVKTIPLAEGAVRFHLGRYRGADFGWHLWVRAITVDFARADGPAPDIHLALIGTAQIDAAVAG